MSLRRKSVFINIAWPNILFFVWTLMLVFIASCSPRAPQSVGEVGQPSLQSMHSESLENQCVQPYAESSIWNEPINWSAARIHPDSKKMMEAFWSGKRWIGSDSSQYAPNIYYVDTTTSLVRLQLRKNRFRDAINDKEIIYGEPSSVVMMPIPPNARPADGTDGQLVIININTGEEWGIIKGEIDILGHWHAVGAYRYSIYNSGMPPAGFGQRGAGIGQLAGVVRPCEVERGYIGHAVTLAYNFPCAPEICEANGWPSFIPPFTKTDGDGKEKYDIPEGARIVVNPEISFSEVEKACVGMKGCVAWIQAMQEFGGFVVDNSNHPKTYPEGDGTANWDADVWSADMLRNIPPEWYDVLDWNEFAP